ncbi:hypothetical protein CLOSTMETH_01820 [[Clostridium] methylpentosum DSM 5476]|uniref:Uncharacterized protein n=1 Tax=[Clostridium] methylpentosum DSM 5476 TaxID=537013 RepID=C0ED94_9FIRM|nr:hypothetical protein CLOSTMETH_01820 [[Clostridium] methylpentosum DSM 5476]
MHKNALEFSFKKPFSKAFLFVSNSFFVQVAITNYPLLYVAKFQTCL